MMSAPITAGQGWLHRQSAGKKLAALAILGMALFLVHSLVVLITALVIAAAILAHVCGGLTPALSLVRPALISVLLFFAINLLVLPAPEAVVVFLRVTVLVLAAAIVTATTQLAEIVSVIDRLARPFEQMGLMQRGDAGLAVGLCLRLIPDIRAQYSELVDAHRARGLKMRPWTIMAPLAIRVLTRADAIADAIDARGLRP